MKKQKQISKFTFNRINYKVKSRTKKTVEVANNQKFSGTAKIPETVKFKNVYYTVVKIGSRAFYRNTKLKSVFLPNTIIEIGSYGFYNCDKTKPIVIPNSVKKIGIYAFTDTKHKVLEIPNGVKIVSANSFSNSDITEGIIRISASVSEIGQSAFYGCDATRYEVSSNNSFFQSIDGVLFSKDGKQLIHYPNRKPNTSYSIPNGVTTIKRSSFENHMKLLKLIMPASITMIENSALKMCTTLTELEVNSSTPPIIEPNGLKSVSASCVITVPEGCIEAYKNSLEWSRFTTFEEKEAPTTFVFDGINYNVLSKNEKSVEIGRNWDYDGVAEIPERVTHNGTTYTVVAVGEEAFRYNRELTFISLPNTIIEIKANSFQYCTIIDPITLPSSVEIIGKNAYTQCSLINLTIPNSVKIIDEGAFYYAFASDKTIKIGANVTSIGRNAFVSCGATNYDVSADNSNYRDIEGVLYNKTGKKIIHYPEGKNNDSFSIPQSVDTIGCNAFAVLRNLKNIVIPSSVTKLDDFAFWNCRYLERLEVQATTPPSVGENGLMGVGSKCVVIVPRGYVKKYETAPGWSDLKGRITDNENLAAHFQHNGIEYNVLSFGDKTAEVGDNGYFNGTAVVPEQVTYNNNTYTVIAVGEYAFYGNRELLAISLPNTIKSLKRYALAYCGKNPISLPHSVEEIDFASLMHTSLETSDLPSDLKIISTYGFYAAVFPNRTVKIPAKVETMGFAPFYACDIEKYEVSEKNPNFKAIDGVLFSKTGDKIIQYPDYKEGTEYSIPQTVTTICECAFLSNPHLIKLVIPSSVTLLEDWAIHYLHSIECIELKATVPPKVIRRGLNSAFIAHLIVVPNGCAQRYKEAETWSIFKDKITDVEDFPATFQYNNINYNILSFDDKTVQVGNNRNFVGTADIPAEIKFRGVTYTVAAIGSGAFKNNNELTSVTLPNTIKHIADYGFSNCNSLSPISIPDSVESIGSGAFYRNRFNTLHLPGSLKYINNTAFSYTTLVNTKVIIPAEVTRIQYAAFRGSNISAYEVSAHNQRYSSIDGVLFNKKFNKLVNYPTQKEGNRYVIPNGVRTIRDYAFECDKLSSIVIPSSVTRLQRVALFNCPSLTCLEAQATTPPFVEPDGFRGVNKSCLIVVPKGCVKKYKTAQGWRDFENIVDDEIPDNFKYNGIIYNVLDYGNKTVEVGDNSSYSGDAIIPENVTHLGIRYTVEKLGYNAFYFNKNLTKFIIPKTVTTIGKRSLYETKIPTNTLVIPEKVVAIEDEAFYEMLVENIVVDENNTHFMSESGVLYNKSKTKLIHYPKLKNNNQYIIPYGIEEIVNQSFNYNLLLNKLFIPESVKTIQERAFIYCPNIKLLVINTQTPPVVLAFGLNGINSQCKVFVPKGCVQKYKTTEGWDKFGDNIKEMPIPYQLIHGFIAQELYSDGDYEGGTDIFCNHNVSFPISERNYWGLSFEFKATELKRQWPMILSTTWRVFGVCLMSDGTIQISTKNQDNYYELEGKYSLNKWHSINLVFENGLLSFQLDNNPVQQIQIEMNLKDGDNRWSSSNYSNAVKFKGYLRNIVY